MNANHYEKHITDSDLPAIMHTDVLRRKGDVSLNISDVDLIQPFHIHWHENIELLYILEGECDVITNTVKICAKPNDIAIINSNMVHQVEATTEYVKYNCLIIDSAFLKSFGIDIENTVFERRIRDKQTQELYLAAVKTFAGNHQYRHLDLKLALFSLAINLIKHHVDSEFTPGHHSSPKAETVKKAIEYMKQHYAEPLNVDSLARIMGFTKYYFCHIFSDVTGSTVINHLNYIRCRNARKLIISGECNITEAAEKSGFTNMSYFAKTYKSFTGELPSETKAKVKKQ